MRPGIGNRFLNTPCSAKGMSEDTIYDRVAKLEDEGARLRKEVDILNMFSKNKLAKLEIKKIKNGDF